MNITEYRLAPDALAAITKEKREQLEANTGETDLLGFGLGVVAGRLRRNPKRYVDYGPYWWALKDVLRRAGYSMGSETDVELVEAFRGADDTETLVGAEEFRDDYLATRVVGERSYQLDGDSVESWSLMDEDMEARA